MTDVLFAEWLKLRSARSTQWVLATVAGFVVLCAVWSFYIANYWDGLSPQRQGELQAAPAEYPLVLTLPLCMAVLGVLAITSEYATGLIRSSLAAVPRRGVLFAGKAVAVGAVASTTGLLSLGVAFALGRLIVGDRAIADFRTPVSDELPWLLSLALSAVVIALVGLGLGTAMRSTAGAVTSLCVLIFVLPGLAQLLPSPWNERFAAILPSNLTKQIAGNIDDAVLGPVPALVVLLAYAVIALAAGLVVLVRRDS
ncbi:ABC transporter permease [Spirillospora sp. NPDC048911]|uniref:ABC transporter permease n=1 Tax=Spirillospora sp. NPDC048911 TaxID=3364527 RepID=UPI003718734C